MEYFYFPKKSYYLTQGYGNNSFSHKGRCALDVSAKNGYKEIYAPFTGYVANIFVKSNLAYTIWLVSEYKIMCADGQEKYAVVMFTHPSEIINFKIGQKFKQWDYLMNDGNTGYATGKHLDFEIALYDNKEDIKATWGKNQYDNYGLINSVNPCDYMILKDDCKILNEYYLNKKYSFKKEKEVLLKYEPGLYQTLDNIRVRTGPSKKYRQKKVKELSRDGQKNATSSNLNAYALYKKGTLFDALSIIKNCNSDIWAKTYSGYVNIIDGIYTNSKRIY